MSRFLNSPPVQATFDVDGAQSSSEWIEWLSAVHGFSKKFRGSGPTAERPVNYLETGDWYFDTTLGKPIWYSGGWVDATGASV